MKLSICIITYLRPDSLKRLLGAIAALEFRQVSAPDIEVVVVDNDPERSGESAFSAVCSAFPHAISYTVEPQRGIPFARNLSVMSASADSDFFVFIDDDEVPDPLWLEQLIVAQSRYQVDVVTGPVVPRFNHAVPDWIAAGKFFERPRYETGTEMPASATNNVLVRADVLRKLDYLFDERLALTGGSDWYLFRRLNRLGHRIVWADDAIVYEWVPESRANLQWILQRGYRCGNTESSCEIDLEPSVSVSSNCIFKGIRRLIRGFLLIPISLAQGKHGFCKNLKYISHSLGLLSGVLGSRYEEYQIIHRA